jgi:hypothetical protein
MKIPRTGAATPLKTQEIAGAKVTGAKPEKASAKSMAQVDTSRATSARRGGQVSDIAADLKAGRISAGAALDKVIERVLDRQLGANAPAGIREKVGAALREALTDDPLLAAKVHSLGKD